MEQPLYDREGADASLIYLRPAGAKGQEGIDFTSLSITGPSGNGVICTLQYRQRGRNCIISVCCQDYEFAWALQQSRKKKKKTPDPWQFELPLTLQVLVPPRHLVGKCLPPFSLWRKMSQIVMIPKMVLSQLAHCEPRAFENRTD